MHKVRKDREIRNIPPKMVFFLKTIPELQTLMLVYLVKTVLAKQVGTRSKGIPSTYGDFEQLTNLSRRCFQL